MTQRGYGRRVVRPQIEIRPQRLNPIDEQSDRGDAEQGGRRGMIRIRSGQRGDLDASLSGQIERSTRCDQESERRRSGQQSLKELRAAALHQLLEVVEDKQR